MSGVEEFDHRGGLKAVPRRLASDVRNAIRPIDPSVGATQTRRQVLAALQGRGGWCNQLELSYEARISLTSCKKRTGLSFQTGNASRLYADLVKLHYAFDAAIIMSAIYLVPCQEVANRWGNNIATFERLTRELALFRRIIPVPILVFGIRFP